MQGVLGIASPRTRDPESSGTVAPPHSDEWAGDDVLTFMPIDRKLTMHAGSIRRTLLLAPLTVVGLASSGCYVGIDENAVFSDVRRPALQDHEELFGVYLPPPPPVDDDGQAIEDFSAAEDDDTAIYGGTLAPVCGWPSTVELGGACTGTLVHPQVVIYAAHCGASYNKIYFGENYKSPAKAVTPSFCKVVPGGAPGGGNDFAVCKLSAPVNDVPITPILMGCETQILKAGQAVTLVGFGNADNGPYGIKRQVTTTINGIDNNNEISIGGNGKDTCQGDSGGPAFVQLADGTWRVFGITSYGGACGSGGMYSMMHKGMSWFESTVGVDLTPCHQADGTWSPSAACGNFPKAPNVGGGTWAGGCNAGSPSGTLSTTCGAAYGGGQPQPQPQPQPQAPCVGCTNYPGSLSGTGDSDQHPNGQYYQSTKSGAHEGYLTGPAGADFDLYIYKWQNNNWAMVAKAETDGSKETLKYNGTAGYYTWVVQSYSGAGNYNFYLKKP
jgi:hypothetical protein